jgi:hypothetical protein
VPLDLSGQPNVFKDAEKAKEFINTCQRSFFTTLKEDFPYSLCYKKPLFIMAVMLSLPFVWSVLSDNGFIKL